MATPKTERYQQGVTAFGLSLTGIIITLLVLLWWGGHPNTQFLIAMSGLFFIGFSLRIARRKLFFGPRHSLHQNISFDALLQGAVILNPQLPYPSTEQSFISRFAGVPPASIQGWFSVRSTAAIAIPSALIGTVGFLANELLIGLLGWATCFLTIGYEAYAFQCEYGRAQRFILAMLMGLLAVLGEGACWTLAGGHLDMNIETWKLFLLYVVSVTAFELSPVPLSLGILELAYLPTAYALDLPESTLSLPLAYRLFRAVPIVALTFFYLPRYKLSVLDLYQPDLASALKMVWHPQSANSNDKIHPFLSIVIPAYNEEARLPLYLPRVIHYCQSLSHPYEIIVVDDGSMDKTADYVQSLNQPGLRLISQPKNLGKGAAVRRGVLEATGSYVLFTDADGATPIEETAKLLTTAKQGGDVIVASRRLAGSQVTRSVFRNLLGTLFFRLTSLLAVPGIADTQCGFKLFTQAAAQRLFPLIKEDGWAFDVELLYLAQKLGMSIREVPVTWTAIEGSKVNPVRDAWKMLRALHRIRTHWKGMHTP